MVTLEKQPESLAPGQSRAEECNETVACEFDSQSLLAHLGQDWPRCCKPVLHVLAALAVPNTSSCLHQGRWDQTRKRSLTMS